ncbi:MULTISPECIES: Hpt domain-containing protein [unclassified Maridesulfovibrio]|uniref:Hpt domain-containing protein n=1 Tax=unclassified Maridesulfovibrio TaxID=2794999 RepID=UPI003B3FE94E
MGLKIVERIDKDLQGLIPGFMEITQKEIKDLEQALAIGEMSVAARIGHNIKGSALNYGFVHLGDIGRRIESSAAQNRQKKVQAELKVLRDYVDRVEVIFV